MANYEVMVIKKNAITIKILAKIILFGALDELFLKCHKDDINNMSASQKNIKIVVRISAAYLLCLLYVYECIT